MSVELRYILSLSIIFAVIIGIVRFRKIDRSYYPFIYYVCLVVIIETAYLILTETGQIEALRVVLNIYAFLEFGLLAWLFHSWGLFNRNRAFFTSLMIGAFVIWLIITVIAQPINKQPNLYFRILYSFALVLFAVSTFNKMVVNHRRKIFENAQFWICLGIIIFFTFFLLDNATKISLLKQNVSRGFRNSLQELLVWTNVLSNLLYAVAAIWIPRKKNFMTSF
jgi:hypothetical protein